MKLEINEFYLNASGEVVKITDKYFYSYCDTNENEYFDDGTTSVRPQPNDLIAEIPKELHKYLIQTIKDYHTDLDFKVTVDNVYGMNNGKF